MTALEGKIKEELALVKSSQSMKRLFRFVYCCLCFAITMIMDGFFLFCGLIYRVYFRHKLTVFRCFNRSFSFTPYFWNIIYKI